jgi:N-acetyl-alpha-D-glucosaminyl L-malate synthase BshA
LARDARAVLDLPDDCAITVIPNFVDTERFAPPVRHEPEQLRRMLADAGGRTSEPWGPVLLHASNFRAVKRPGDLIEVLAQVRKSLPARLVLIGDGPERARVLEKAREIGVERYVITLGHRADFVAHLQHADVFLSSSEAESFGLAALEALSCGVPVCGYRVGGLHEVVGDDAGNLVTPLDTRALAEATLALLRDDAARARLGAAGRARAVAQFQLEPALQRYERLYEHALRRAPKEPS